MKNRIVVISCFVLALFSETARAQSCTGCTKTISGVETAPQVILTGQVLCITSTGDLQGNLVINQGTVCNEGSINSPDISMTSGSFTNYGAIDSDAMLMMEGDFTNEGSAIIDSLALGGSGNVITNSSQGIITAQQVALAKTTFNTDPTINNGGTFTTDSILVGISSAINNTGTFTVNFDMAVGTGGTFTNDGIMSVGDDFANSGTFNTNCMIPVGGDWANMAGAFIEGPNSGCGGFNVTGASANSGNFAAGGSFLDMCDAGGPAGGFDVNTGVAGTNATYCSCTTTCTIGTPTSLISHTGNRGAVTLYPNPAKDYVILRLENWDGQTHSFTLLDLSGKEVKVVDMTAAETNVISTNDLASGMYLYQVSDRNGVVDYGKLFVD